MNNCKCVTCFVCRGTGHYDGDYVCYECDGTGLAEEDIEWTGDIRLKIDSAGIALAKAKSVIEHGDDR